MSNDITVTNGGNLAVADILGIVAGAVSVGEAKSRIRMLKVNQGALSITEGKTTEPLGFVANGYFIAVQPQVGRVFFTKSFSEDPKQKPACSSLDGNKPLATSPAIQATACSTCPKNVPGTASDGKGKACTYKQSAMFIPSKALTSVADARKAATLVRLGSLSLWAEKVGVAVPEYAQPRNWNAYQEFLATKTLNHPETGAVIRRGLPLQFVETAVMANTAQTVQALAFHPAAPGLNGGHIAIINELSKDTEWQEFVMTAFRLDDDIEAPPLSTPPALEAPAAPAAPALPTAEPGRPPYQPGDVWVQHPSIPEAWKTWASDNAVDWASVQSTLRQHFQPAII